MSLMEGRIIKLTTPKEKKTWVMPNFTSWKTGITNYIEEGV